VHVMVGEKTERGAVNSFTQKWNSYYTRRWTLRGGQKGHEGSGGDAVPLGPRERIMIETTKGEKSLPCCKT